MGLIQKLKSALGLNGARSPEPGTAPPRDVDVTVEREPSSESEDAVKGTETAASETATTDESDVEEARTDEPSRETAPIEEAEPTVDDATEGESGEVERDEPAEEPTDESTGEPADPVTDISGIGPAYGQRLADVGVETVDDLAAADPVELEEATDISASRVEGWIDAAAEY